jgi:hypothetical protein
VITTEELRQYERTRQAIEPLAKVLGLHDYEAIEQNHRLHNALVTLHDELAKMRTAAPVDTQGGSVGGDRQRAREHLDQLARDVGQYRAQQPAAPHRTLTDAELGAAVAARLLGREPVSSDGGR